MAQQSTRESPNRSFFHLLWFNSLGLATDTNDPICIRSSTPGICESIWWNLDESDWLEAFTHHPKIGEDKAALQAKFAKTAALSASEQEGVDGASEAILNRLVDGNNTYLKKFGFIFIVCAQGKSAEEMCQLLEARLNNHRDQEPPNRSRRTSEDHMVTSSKSPEPTKSLSIDKEENNGDAKYPYSRYCSGTASPQY